MSVTMYIRIELDLHELYLIHGFKPSAHYANNSPSNRALFIFISISISLLSSLCVRYPQADSRTPVF